ncbi:MAG: hypothetical protein HYY84_13015 [Deltaproteobacteria bacterium]|nr:hypothetical protein [Deltaproteobacteria bacterium]
MKTRVTVFAVGGAALLFALGGCKRRGEESAKPPAMKPVVINPAVAVPVPAAAPAARVEAPAAVPVAPPTTPTPTPTTPTAVPAAPATPTTPTAAVGGDGEYEEIAKVEGGGTIVGAVKWTGGAVKLPPLKFKPKDEKVCGSANGERPSERLYVDGATKGVKNTIVSLADIRKGRPVEKKDAVLDQKGCTYDPHVQVATKGTQLEVVNSDSVNHNVHPSLEGTELFNLAQALKGQRDPQRLRKKGLMEVKCDIHVWMSAFILVVDHPYHHVTNDKGEFKLTDVPPGEYTIRAWHEGWNVERTESDGRAIYAAPKIVEKKVKVEAGKEARVDFDLAG